MPSSDGKKLGILSFLLACLFLLVACEPASREPEASIDLAIESGGVRKFSSSGLGTHGTTSGEHRVVTIHRNDKDRIIAVMIWDVEASESDSSFESRLVIGCESDIRLTFDRRNKVQIKVNSRKLDQNTTILRAGDHSISVTGVTFSDDDGVATSPE